MIDALFFSRIMFSCFEATAVHCASDAVIMMAYVECCVGGGTGGGGGVLLCANNKPTTPRYSPLGKPAHLTDRPTDGHHKAAICLGGGIFHFFTCALRPCTNPIFTSFLTQTPIMLTKELVQLPDAPSRFAQRCKL